MSLWVEIRCERSGDAGCYSSINDGPMCMIAHARAAKDKGIRKLEREAIADGWIKRGADFYCPSCKGPEKQP